MVDADDEYRDSDRTDRRRPDACRIAGRRYPLMLPSLGDPRLHIAAVVVSLQVLGQTALGFDLSIAQILVALADLRGDRGRHHLPGPAGARLACQRAAHGQRRRSDPQGPRHRAR